MTKNLKKIFSFSYLKFPEKNIPPIKSFYFPRFKHKKFSGLCIMLISKIGILGRQTLFFSEILCLNRNVYTPKEISSKYGNKVHKNLNNVLQLDIKKIFV